MSDYQIAENVLGVPLFVPSSNNYFSVGVGEMPDGSDCLVVHGDVSRDYKAYHPAPLTGSYTGPANVFSNWNGVDPHSGLYGANHNVSESGGTRGNEEFSISFWFKGAPVTEPVGTYHDSRHILFAVMNAYADNISVTTVPGRISPDPGSYAAGSSTPWLPDLNWAVTMYGADKIAFIKQYTYRNTTSSTYGGDSTYCVTNTIPTNQWTLIVFNIGAYAGNTVSSSTAYINDEFSGNSGSYESADALTNYPQDTYLSIGSYSDGNNMSGRSNEWRIGRLSFHDHHLTHEERTLLYHTMVS